MATTDSRIAATRRYLESARDSRLKKFDWMSRQSLGRAGNMSAGRRDQLMTDLTGEKADIEEQYRSQLGLQEATWKREDDLKRAQGQAATIKTIGTILGGVVGSTIPGVGTIAGITAGAGIGAAAGGLLGSAVSGEPDTAAMAPNELIAAIQGLSSTDYIDQAMKLIGMDSQQPADPRLDAVLRLSRWRNSKGTPPPQSVNEMLGQDWGGQH